MASFRTNAGGRGFRLTQRHRRQIGIRTHNVRNQRLGDPGATAKGGAARRCGHQPFALVGGATGLVGDPSGKSTERPPLSSEVRAPLGTGPRGVPFDRRLGALATSLATAVRHTHWSRGECNFQPCHRSAWKLWPLHQSPARGALDEVCDLARCPGRCMHGSPRNGVCAAWAASSVTEGREGPDDWDALAPGSGHHLLFTT